MAGMCEVLSVDVAVVLPPPLLQMMVALLHLLIFAIVLDCERSMVPHGQ